MSNAVTDRERYEAAELLLRFYAEQVHRMRLMQRARSPHEPLVAVAARTKQEDEVDSLTTLHLLPPIPTVSSSAETPPPSAELPSAEGRMATGRVAGLELIGHRYTKPAFKVTMQPKQVLLRVDDQQHRTSWLELTISEDLVFFWNRYFADLEDE